MSDSLLDKYLRKPVNESSIGRSSVDSDEPGDLGCFGFLRGVRDRAIMLELRKKDGTVTAMAYAYIERIAYCPDGPNEGITIYGAGQKIRMSGRNLNAQSRDGEGLFGALTRHRVPWVREADRMASIAADTQQAEIDFIEW